MAMSFKRKWFELRRMLRHQTLIFIIFGVSILGFIFFISSSYSNGNALESLSLERRREHPRAMGLSENENVELPGGQDPDTIFRAGVIGNFENVPDFGPVNHIDAPGEDGKPVKTDLDSPQVRRANSEYGFNTMASDLVAMNRTIPDVRMNECKYWHYPENMPAASVVIAFHNEGWSPLLRTVHSVLLRSPHNLLKEVILVDDFSNKDHLKEKLDEYIKQFNGKVRLIRNKEREGLIRTRTIGAQAAEGEVVIFLDAHCEVNKNWLPPLLAPIRLNRKIMTVPVIDGIDMNTWEYRRVYGEADRHFRGIFEWGLLYKETELPEQEKRFRKQSSEPFRSPTHAGGLFAINKSWFEELGYYDPGLQIWGGEQYELSFKIWQCGGGILFVPCSHVGHVYRNHMPYNFGKLTGKPVISTNLIRVIKTWMDDYGKYYYIREPQAKYREPGDISAQLALRERLKCKSFNWYVENVAYDVQKSYPLLPENDVWGEAKNPASGKCIDSMGRAIPGTMGASPCHGYGGNQLIRLNKKGQLTQGEWCITPVSTKLRTGHCVKGTIDGPFLYDRDTTQIHEVNAQKCLTVEKDPNSSELLLANCDSADPLQKWVWTEKYS
ncbi:glycosyl transferase family 2 domain-containing protein [Ditylenchus destructor]|uniref:Polypeptide N-acetylgalactosaminyltransferase n=1 Tax=Ditylenchus destructor TaxID=166010 RepID=A0AAD4R7I3_9BILA|nr:glycosyl transferase family 2 domain-containing protein [Ditylenchus destructor]